MYQPNCKVGNGLFTDVWYYGVSINYLTECKVRQFKHTQFTENKLIQIKLHINNK